MPLSPQHRALSYGELAEYKVPPPISDTEPGREKKLRSQGRKLLALRLLSKVIVGKTLLSCTKIERQMQVNDRPAVQFAAQIIFLILGWWLDCSVFTSEISLTHQSAIDDQSVVFLNFQFSASFMDKEVGGIRVRSDPSRLR